METCYYKKEKKILPGPLNAKLQIGQNIVS